MLVEHGWSGICLEDHRMQDCRIFACKSTFWRLQISLVISFFELMRLNDAACMHSCCTSRNRHLHPSRCMYQVKMVPFAERFCHLRLFSGLQFRVCWGNLAGNSLRKLIIDVNICDHAHLICNQLVEHAFDLHGMQWAHTQPRNAKNRPSWGLSTEDFSSPWGFG